MEHALEQVGRLTDSELICRLERLVQADRALSAKLLVHLGELDERRLFAGRGFGSMFEYCRHGLRMSDAEAYLRIQAARVGRRFPLVVERLAAGAVHLTAIKLLSSHLTQENHVQLLDRVRGRTKREVEVIVAELSPKPDVPARVRKLPDVQKPAPQPSDGAPAAACVQPLARESSAAQPPTREALAIAPSQPAPQPSGEVLATTTVLVVSKELTEDGTTAQATNAHAAQVTVAAPEPKAGQPMAAEASQSFALQSPPPRATVTPLGLGRFKLALTLGQDAHDALDQLRELLRHQNPSGDLTRIVERALLEMLERTKKQRFALHSAPARRTVRKSDLDDKDNAKDTATDHAKAKVSDSAKGPSRYIPREVLRQVHARDAGQCTFVSPDGRRCTERGFLEIHHHHTTFARGGQATVENLRLTCRVHNRYFAEQDYGPGFLRNKLRQVAARSGEQLRL